MYQERQLYMYDGFRAFCLHVDIVSLKRCVLDVCDEKVYV